MTFARRAWLILPALVLPAAASRAQDVAVERRSASPVTVAGGGQVTTIFRLTNRGPQRSTVVPLLDAPAGWSIVIADTAASLAGRESRVSVFLLAIPAATRPGPYPIRFRAQPGGAADSVMVIVSEHHGVEATALSSPKFVAAGEAYQAQFLVRNSGNGAARFELQSRAGGARARLDSAAVHLEPGETRVVTVTVQTSEDAAKVVAQAVQLTARAASDTSAVATGAAIVQVVPVHAVEPERFRTLPAQLTFVQAGSSGVPTPELSGAGFLTPKGRTRMDFMLRGRQPAAAYLGMPDEYWVSFSAAKRYRVRVGDAAYRGTRLTESGRQSFGSEAELHLANDAVIVSAYAQRDRRSWSLTREQLAGGAADVRVAPRLLLGGGYAYRSGVDAATILTTRGTLSASSLANVRWEYGRSSGAHGSGGATIVTLDGVAVGGHLGYGARHEAADIGFGGLWRGTKYDDATLSIRLPRAISMVGSIAQSSRPQANFVGGDPVTETVAEAGLGWGSLLQASFRRRDETGQVLLASPGQVTESVRLQSGLPVGPAYLHGEIENGRTQRAISAASLPYTRGAGRVSAVIGQQSVTLGVMRFTGVSGYSPVPRGETTVMGNASFRLTGSTRLNVIATGMRTSGAGAQTFSLVDVGLTQQLPRGHRTRLQARSSSSGPSTLGFDRRATLHQSEYMLPLELPIGAPSSGGNVEVRLIDAATDKPVSGILMRVANEARFTDRDGRAIFTALDSGTYYLEVEREKLGVGRVVSPILPLSIAIKGTETKRVDLRVMTAARVTGRVRLMAFATGRPFGAADSLVDAGPYPGLVLSLVDGDTLRTVVDGFGRFSFEHLHPGPWQLRVISGVGPDQTLDATEVSMDLAGGAVREVELRVIPTSVAPRFQPTEVIPTGARADSAAASRPSPPVAPAVVPARRPRPTLPPPPPYPVAGPGWRPPVVSHYYTVTRHDVGLIAIARAMYGNAALWPKIWLANLDALRDPGVLRAGQRLRIPDRAPLTREEIAAREAYQRRRR